MQVAHPQARPTATGLVQSAILIGWKRHNLSPGREIGPS